MEKTLEVWDDSCCSPTELKVHRYSDGILIRSVHHKLEGPSKTPYTYVTEYVNQKKNRLFLYLRSNLVGDRVFDSDGRIIESIGWDESGDLESSFCVVYLDSKSKITTYSNDIGQPYLSIKVVNGTDGINRDEEVKDLLSFFERQKMRERVFSKSAISRIRRLALTLGAEELGTPFTAPFSVFDY